MSVDKRFYRFHEALPLRAVAIKLGLYPGDYPDMEITGISAFGHARSGELCFFENSQKATEIGTSLHCDGICLSDKAVSEKAAQSSGLQLIVANPKRVFFRLASEIYSPIGYSDDGPPANIHASAHLGPGCIIGHGAAIGARSDIGPNTVIGPGVQIGSDCKIGANATIGFCLMGNHVRVLSGARIGEAGFGLMPSETGAEEIPHFGRVILQDHVYIGANTCIDRGFLEDTIIGDGSKIDNMSHIGHNCVLGRNVVMAAYAGISGSVTIGDGVQMGGRVGVVDHVQIGAGSQIAAGSNVLSSVPAGVVWGGIPARPIKEWQRETVWLKRSAAKGKAL